MNILAFNSPAEFRAWLEANHASSDGVWLQIWKKGAGRASVTYAEALDEALCFGWIDGQRKPGGEGWWLLRFTPRRPRSAWSRVNIGHVDRLTRAGLMAPAGLAAVEAARADGRWEAAYDSQRNAKAPEDFIEALARLPKARVFYEGLSKANVYAIVYRLQSARKPETRERRMRKILEMLERGEVFHPPAKAGKSKVGKEGAELNRE